MNITERLGGPHEWGYRDPTDGRFISDNAPFEGADEIERLRAPFKHVDGLDWDYLERLLVTSMRHQQDSQTRIWIEAIRAARAALLPKDGTT